MNFQLSDEQQMLADSARQFVRDHSSVEQLRQQRQLATPDAAAWQQFAELGWLAVPFEEQHGGLGLGVIETMVLLEHLGEGLVMAPYIATVVLGGGFLRRAPLALQDDRIPALIAGELQMAFAVEEYERVFSLENTALRAEPDGDDFRLNGCKACVLNGDQADLLVVLARSGATVGQRDGLSLLLVAADADGVTRLPHRTVDGRQGAEIRFDNVRVARSALIGEQDQGYAIAQAVLQEGLLAIAAECLGSLSVLLAQTVAYSKTRQQFGVPIGSFQVLQHRMADMFIILEQTRSLLQAATLLYAANDEQAVAAVHALKAQLGRGGRTLAQHAIQIHGGMGMTDELDIGHHAKRITAADGLFGNADRHLQAMAGS